MVVGLTEGEGMAETALELLLLVVAEMEFDLLVVVGATEGEGVAETALELLLVVAGATEGEEMLSQPWAAAGCM